MKASYNITKITILEIVGDKHAHARSGKPRLKRRARERWTENLLNRRNHAPLVLLWRAGSKEPATERDETHHRIIRSALMVVERLPCRAISEHARCFAQGEFFVFGRSISPPALQL